MYFSFMLMLIGILILATIAIATLMTSWYWEAKMKEYKKKVHELAYTITKERQV